MGFSADRRTGQWTEAEDDQLRHLVAEHGTTSWTFISQYIPGRDSKSCRHRWTNRISPMVFNADRRTGRWTEAEDDQLRHLVAEHGTTSWALISQYIPGRDSKSCRQRWTNQISPEIVHAPFTSDEDAKIVEEYERRGSRWAAIARLLPGRGENSVKSRWNSNLKHRDRGRAEGVTGKRRYQDDDVGRALKKANSGFSPSGSYISRRNNTVVSSTERQSSNVVLSPSVSGDGSSNAVKAPRGSNFDDGAVDPLTTLSRWLPYGGTSKNTGVLQN